MQWPFERDIEFSISTQLGLGYPARAKLLVVVPAVTARADLLAAPAPVQHRPAGDDDRRDVGARGAHDARRVRLVAPGEEHDSVERVRANGLFDVHRHQIPVEHRRRLHERLAQRQHRELERETASLQNTALDRLGQPAQVHVAVDELAPAVGDADHRTSAEGLVRHAGRLQPRSVQESVEITTPEPLLAAEGVVASLERPFVPNCRHFSSLSSLQGHATRARRDRSSRRWPRSGGTCDRSPRIRRTRRGPRSAESSTAPQLHSASSTPRSKLETVEGVAAVNVKAADPGRAGAHFDGHK